MRPMWTLSGNGSDAKLLAIDAGNTNIVFAVMHNGEVSARWRIATDARRTADEYAVWLRQLMQLAQIDPAAIKSVIISTVVPRALHNLTLLAQNFPDTKRGLPYLASFASACGVSDDEMTDFDPEALVGRKVRAKVILNDEGYFALKKWRLLTDGGRK